MQSIARLAGPVVHGFKRGSKLLGWCVATHVMSATIATTRLTCQRCCNSLRTALALLEVHCTLNILIALRPTANLGVTDAELEALAAGEQLSECSVESL
jgi:hypothetical protein